MFRAEFDDDDDDHDDVVSVWRENTGAVEKEWATETADAANAAKPKLESFIVNWLYCIFGDMNVFCLVNNNKKIICLMWNEFNWHLYFDSIFVIQNYFTCHTAELFQIQEKNEVERFSEWIRSAF